MVLWSSLALCHLLATASAVNLKGTELAMVFVVHRHGDRTPTETSVKLSTNPQALIRLSKPYGYGQLTEKGMQRAYKLGQFLRYRYNDLLGSRYNSSNVYIRSTDVTRAKMTILVALAAIYPPGKKNWSPHIHWTPVPYTTTPKKYDYNLAYINCPVFINNSKNVYSTNPPEFEKYKDALKTVSDAIGVDVVSHPVLAYDVNDILTVQESIGLPIPWTLERVMPDIQAAAAKALDFIFADENASLEAGVLLEEFLKYSEVAISGNQTERIRIYSAHDYNVYALEIVTQATPKQGVPYYASAYSLELRRNRSTGQYIVVPIYLPQPGQEIVYLQIKGCGVPCDYNKFVELNKANALSYRSWQNECGFYEDLDINKQTNILDLLGIEPSDHPVVYGRVDPVDCSV